MKPRVESNKRFLLNFQVWVVGGAGKKDAVPLSVPRQLKQQGAHGFHLNLAV